MEVLTTETLASAINYSPEYSHMGDDESSYLAEHILNFFGYSDRIIDNVLHPEDRDTFYMLEDAGLMETEREETTLYDGRSILMRLREEIEYQIERLTLGKEHRAI